MRLAAGAGTMLGIAAQRVRAALHALHVIVGGPDYERYLAHLRTHHPDTVPMSRAEFERGEQEKRAKPGARCC